MSRRVAATIFAAPARSRAWQRSACKGDLLTAVPRNRDVFTHSTHLQIRSFHPSLYIFAEEKSSEGTSEYSSPIARYSALVDSGLLREDSHQREVVGMLEKLHDELKTYEHKVRPESETVAKTKGGGGLFTRLFRKRQPEDEHGHLPIPHDIPKGLYLFGDVGCGKSMLMDLFYETLPPKVTHKRRVHFHQFMIDAHKRMHAFKAERHKPSGMVMSAATAAVAVAASRSSTVHDKLHEEVDPIPHVARQFALEAGVLCFDEFQVTDIADAMILRRLFEHMLWHGVVCIATSNRHPDELYKNGIQRSSFVPCIDLLKDQLHITDLDSGTDYRRLPRALTKVYFSPLTNENKVEMDKLWHALTSDPADPPIANRSITIWGRKVLVPESTRNNARFSFAELCGKPKSAADYIEICRQFKTIFIDDIPKMNLHSRDLARRFITFIDAAYESKTKIFASSEVEILKIFTGDVQEGPTKDQMRALMDDLGLTMEQIGGLPMATGEEETFAFARVLSRLSEMGSKQYAQLAGHSEAPPES